MADDKKQQLDTTFEFQQIARERLLWAIKPIFVVILVVWCLHPGTTHPDKVEKNAQLGFLLGAFYGIFSNRETLFYHLFTRRRQESKEVRNRMPDEYYFGKVKAVLQKEEL